MHLVLDLDETLVSSKEFTVIFRPYLKEFMEFCFSNFETVSIWSAADVSYVERISKLILPSDRNWTFVYSYSHCKKIVSYVDDEFSAQYKIRKPLQKIWRRSIARKLGMHKRNTLVVDDDRSNCVENYGNAIYVDEFDGRKSDRLLLDLMDYLKKDLLSRKLKDVCCVEKREWRAINSCF